MAQLFYCQDQGIGMLYVPQYIQSYCVAAWERRGKAQQIAAEYGTNGYSVWHSKPNKWQGICRPGRN